MSCDEDKHRHNAKVHSRHILITVITRYQLVKSVHVLVELIITICELGVFRATACTRDRCSSRGTSEKWWRFQRKLLLLCLFSLAIFIAVINNNKQTNKQTDCNYFFTWHGFSVLQYFAVAYKCNVMCFTAASNIFTQSRVHFVDCRNRNG